MSPGRPGSTGGVSERGAQPQGTFAKAGEGGEAGTLGRVTRSGGQCLGLGERTGERLTLGAAVAYRWLGIASFGVPEKLGCAGLPLTSRQKELCRRKPYLLPSIREGARLGIQECRSQFRHERWSCQVAAAAAAPGSAPLFGYELSSGESGTVGASATGGDDPSNSSK